MQLSGAQILVQSLKAEGVEYVFGYPGGAVLEIYDALFQLNKFKHILVRHEQAAVHAADAYARTSGKVGVALVTSGPGATNAITGIATAYTDSIPMVVISGQVGTPAIGSDAFQEIDMVGVSRPCVKHNFLVTNINELAETVKKSLPNRQHRSPRPCGGGYRQRCNASDGKIQLSARRYFYPFVSTSYARSYWAN